MLKKFDMSILKKAFKMELKETPQPKMLPLLLVFTKEQWLNDEVLQFMFAFTEEEIETALQKNDGKIGKRGGYFCIVGLTRNEVKQ